MPPKPVQAPASFVGVPNILSGLVGPNFARQIEIQDGVALDGSDRSLRTYSPFLIRVVLPTALGGDSSTTLQTQRNPLRAPPSATVRSDNRDGFTYSQGQESVRVNPSGRTAYDRLVDTGNAVPGLTKASTQALEQAYNQAQFQQVFGPTVQNVTHPPQSTRTNNVTPAVTNDTSALSLAVQIKQLSEVPPLLLLVNPSSMKVDYTKVAQFQSRNRYGYHYEAWGEEMAKLSFTFKIGAYTAGLQNVTQRGSVVSGVQRASRNDSAAFQQLQTLLAMFQGATYLQDTENHTRAFPLVGNLAIEYDQMVYVGHMENFSFQEDEQKQHGGLEISVDFVANRVYDVSEPSSDIRPMTNPNKPSRSRGSFLRGGNGNNGLSFFTVPNVGGNSPITQITNEAWARATAPDPRTSSDFEVRVTRRR